jgi:putative ABC transport system permease protein
LVQVWNSYPPTLPKVQNSAGDFRDFQQRARSFSVMAAYIDTPRGLNLTGAGEPERLEARYATSRLFPMLGINTVAGRGFTPEEDSPGSPSTVLISQHLWQRHFGSDPGVVGQTLTLDGRSYVLAGVLPVELELAPTTDLWMPMGQYGIGPDPYRYHEFNIIGRLKPGANIGQARIELTALNRQAQRALPDTHKNFGVVVTPMEAPSATKMRTALLVLFAAVALVLLVACSNFVNLLMARNAARERELALRVALGANRSRLLRQTLAESVLLSLLGGVLGLLIAEVGLRLLGVLVPAELADVNESSLNVWVLAFALALSFLSGIACGLIPGLQVSKPDLQRILREGTRAKGATRGHAIRRALVVCEIALAIIPLVGAGLLIRSLQHLLEVNPGFRHDHTLVMEVDKPQYSPEEQSKLTVDQRLAFLREQSTQYDALIQRIEALPGVKAAGGVSVLPLGTAMRSASRFLVEGQPVPADGVRPVAETRSVSPDYFAVMEIPLRAGRPLDAHDYASQNILINEAIAEKFWPGIDPVGKRINFCTLEPEPCWTTVVGVVGNVHQYGLEAASTFDTYSTLGWLPYTVVRTASNPIALAQTVIGEIHKVDPDLPVTHVMTLDNLFTESVAPRRFSTFLLSLFAGLALLLATIGVYAVTSYAVRMRTNEIGVRMALGAQSGNIWWLIISGGMRLIVAGVGLGLAGAFALTKLIQSLLYGVTAADPITFSCVGILLAGVALLACYVPARQAMRMDPLAARRRE